jgi:hypothetical protein
MVHRINLISTHYRARPGTLSRGLEIRMNRPVQLAMQQSQHPTKCVESVFLLATVMAGVGALTVAVSMAG